MTQMDALASIWQGFGVTASVTLLSLLYAVPFALVLGVIQYNARGWRRFAATSLIEFWRSSPIVILLFVFYYALPIFGVTLGAMTVGTMVIGLNIGGYGSQAVRAALQTIDRGQREAGAALGLSRMQTLILVEMPQAIRLMLPTVINLFIQLVKSTTLVSLLTLADMTYRAKQYAQMTYDPAAAYGGLLVSFFVICYPLTILGRRLERLLAVEGKTRHEL